MEPVSIFIAIVVRITTALEYHGDGCLWCLCMLILRCLCLQGMERRDLIAKNVPIMAEHGKALAKRANDGVRVLVVANPACTNCLVVSRCRFFFWRSPKGTHHHAMHIFFFFSGWVGFLLETCCHTAVYIALQPRLWMSRVLIRFTKEGRFSVYLNKAQFTLSVA